MASNTRNRWLDVPLSVLLGIGFGALLGYLLGLRIIIWNPDLSDNFRNIVFLSLSLVYLYGLLGIFVGLAVWFLVRTWGRLALRVPTGRTFVGPWLVIYWIGLTLLFIYLALTRQNLRSHNFDNFLLVAYYLSFVFLGYWLRKSMKLNPQSSSVSNRLFTLPKFFILCVVYVIVALGITIVSLPDTSVETGFGDITEINAALAAASSDSTRIAIIGWDGAEWDVINKLFDQGQLPNLKKLVDGGVSAPLRSLDELRSPLIWTSMATGKTPAKHGIQDFGAFQFPGMVNSFTEYPDGLGFYRLVSTFLQSADLPVTSSSRRCEAIWNLLSSAKRTVGITGWWASWPAEKVNGFILSDRFTYTLFNPRASALSLTAGQTYPPDLLKEVNKFCRLPESITDAEIGRFMPHEGKFAAPAGWGKDESVDWNPMYQFKLAYTASESFAKAGEYLYKKYCPDLFAVYFEGPDMVSHFFWQYYDPASFDSVSQEDVTRFGRVIPEFYQYMDDLLGQYLALLAPGTDVIILSDHGFGPDPQPKVPFRTGEHRTHGIFVAQGPHFRQGIRLDKASVLDITPTLLYLYGLPTAKDMDGQILLEALDPSLTAQRPPLAIKSYEVGRRHATIVRSEADAVIKDQIRALGYTQ